VRRAAVGVLLVLTACSADVSRLPRVSARESITLISPAFRDGGPVPAAFTCDGQDVHPPVRWMGGPPAEEFALIMVDKSAGEFVHWIVYGIPGTVTGLGEGTVSPPAREGTNTFERVGYGGPCPPRGDQPHLYVFTLYGLRIPRAGSLRSGAALEEVLDAIRCCIQSRGSLSGIYGR
jgi:Raf kinase inhibitor-like YbhB/YbcL family protein